MRLRSRVSVDMAARGQGKAPYLQLALSFQEKANQVSKYAAIIGGESKPRIFEAKTKSFEGAHPTCTALNPKPELASETCEPNEAVNPKTTEAYF